MRFSHISNAPMRIERVYHRLKRLCTYWENSTIRAVRNWVHIQWCKMFLQSVNWAIRIAMQIAHRTRLLSVMYNDRYSKLQYVTLYLKSQYIGGISRHMNECAAWKWNLFATFFCKNSSLNAYYSTKAHRNLAERYRCNYTYWTKQAYGYLFTCDTTKR